MKNKAALTLIIINSFTLLLVVIWFLVGRFFVMPTDSFTILLLDIGSIMGAIFAAGGLVVALVSIFTLVSIDDKIGQGVLRAYEHLQQELIERTDHQIEAHISFFRATTAGDW